MRYKVMLSYDGSPFSGWQIQNQESTVQGSLQKALQTLLKEEIAVTGAGRTDSKVNAVGYVAHFDSAKEDLDTAGIGYKLNAILPPSIAIHTIVPVPPDFHARFDARIREYKYFIHRRKDPFMQEYSYLYTFPLDVPAMNTAAQSLLGEHDFSCFEKVGSDTKTSICKVAFAHWDRWEPGHVRMLGYPSDLEAYLVFTVRADRFLRNMVRAMVGTLLEIGRGKLPPGRIQELLQGGTRSDAGESVPGHALFLSKVTYIP